MFETIVLAQQLLELPTWLQQSGFGVIIILFVWWVWHTTANAIPAMHREQKEHIQILNTANNKTIEKIAADHKEVVSGMMQEFRSDNKEQRDSFAAQQQVILNHLKDQKSQSRRQTKATDSEG